MSIESISGSVIQRTFVGTDISATLYAASVPLVELGIDDEDIDQIEMKQLVGELFAIPADNVLNDEEYIEISNQDQGAFYESNILQRSFIAQFGPFGKEPLAEWEARSKEVADEIERMESPIQLFAEHSIALMLSGDQNTSPLSLYPFTQFPSRLSALDFDEIAHLTAVRCINARLWRSERVAEYTEGILQYDLPVGNSPRAKSDSLLNLLEQGKKMCLAPLGAAGLTGIGLLTHGQYVAAILCTGAGGAMTLILLGTIAVGSLLISRVARERSRNRGRMRNQIEA